MILPQEVDSSKFLDSYSLTLVTISALPWPKPCSGHSRINDAVPKPLEPCVLRRTLYP